VQVGPRTFYVALVAPFLIWTLADAANSAWVRNADFDRGPTISERALLVGGMWVARRTPFVVIIGYALIPIATLAGPWVVRASKHPFAWIAILAASLVLVVATIATSAFFLVLPLVVSAAAAYGVSMATSYQAQRDLVAQGRARIPAPWLLILVCGLQQIHVALGIPVLVAAIIWGRRARVSGGAVQQADAADKARRSCR